MKQKTVNKIGGLKVRVSLERAVPTPLQAIPYLAAKGEETGITDGHEFEPVQEIGSFGRICEKTIVFLAAEAPVSRPVAGRIGSRTTHTTAANNNGAMDLGNMVGPSFLGVVNQAGMRPVDPKFAEASRQIAKIKIGVVADESI